MPDVEWREPRTVAVALLFAIGASLIVAFLYAPEWGAVITALSSSALTCVSLANTWSDRNEVNRPRVIFYAHREGDDILFTVTNIGRRSAFDVRVKMKKEILFRLGNTNWPDVQYHDLRDLVGFFHTPIAMLAPSQTLTSLNRLRTRSDEPLEETALQRFLLPANENNSGVVSYRDQAEKQYQEPVELGFAAFENMKLVTTVNRGSTRELDE